MEVAYFTIVSLQTQVVHINVLISPLVSPSLPRMLELTSIMTGPALPALSSLGRLWSSLSLPTSPPSGARIWASAENNTLGLAQLRHTQLVIPGALVTRGNTVISRKLGRCLQWNKLQTGESLLGFRYLMVSVNSSADKHELVERKLVRKKRGENHSQVLYKYEWNTMQ